MTPSIGWDRQLPTVARHRSFPSGPRLSGPAEAEPPTGGSGGLSPVVSICPSALRPRWSRATDRGNRWPVTGHRRKDTGGGESSTRVRRSEWPGDDPLDAGSLEMGGGDGRLRPSRPATEVWQGGRKRWRRSVSSPSPSPPSSPPSSSSSSSCNDAMKRQEGQKNMACKWASGNEALNMTDVAMVTSAMIRWVSTTFTSNGGLGETPPGCTRAQCQATHERPRRKPATTDTFMQMRRRSRGQVRRARDSRFELDFGRKRRRK